MLPGWLVLLMLQNPPATPAVPTLHQAEASVLQVRGKLRGMMGSRGSGVVVAPGLVVTNAHVIEGAHEITLHQGSKRWIVTQTWMDAARDLCLLAAPGLNAPVAVLAPEPTEPGQTVVAVGFPGGRGPVRTVGRLRGVWHLGEGRLLQSDAPISPGSSGGGLFDDQGRLLGITTQTLTSSARMNLSISVAWIQELVINPERRGTSPQEWSLGARDAHVLEKLASDPRNRAELELVARQWVLDFPKDENGWMVLGMTLDHSARGSTGPGPGGLPEAVEAYRRSLALHREAKAWNNLGADLDLLNRFDEAERAYGEALSMEPAYALAWLNLGGTRMNAGRFAGAVQAFEKGLALCPDEADAWAKLATCQRLLRQTEAAVATLQIALRYRPLVADVWLEWGLLQVELGHVDEAREVHLRLIPMNPELAARLKASLNRFESIQSSKAAGARKRRRRSNQR